MRRPATRIAPLLLFVITASAAEAQSPPESSSQLAKQLVSALSGSGMDAIAVRDPQSPDRAIAALVFPESQLLVIAAKYPEPASLDALLKNKMYRDIYGVLQQPSVNAGKLFIQDLGCDGLQSGSESVDIVYEDGTTQTILDGDWKKQGLKQEEYQERAARAETRYARLLSLLIARARSGTL